MSKNLNIIKAIDLLDGAVAAAKKLGAKNYQTVQQWAIAGIVPPQYCPEIERLTGVSRKLLRPHDWQKIWPELVKAA